MGRLAGMGGEREQEVTKLGSPTLPCRPMRAQPASLVLFERRSLNLGQNSVSRKQLEYLCFLVYFYIVRQLE